jgi:4-carboxymuconolactone decarboxylase
VPQRMPLSLAGLDLQTRELLILCVLSALGRTEVQIKSHAAGNLKVGNSREILVSAITSAFLSSDSQEP